MLIFNILLLLIFFAGFLITRNHSPDIWKEIDKKEHKLFVLYPLADWIITKLGLENFLQHKTKVTDSIKALYVTAKTKQLQRLYWCSRIAVIIMIIVLFNFLSLLGQLANLNSSPIYDGKYLTRPMHGSGSSEVELKVEIHKTEKSEASKEDKYPQYQDITVNVSEQNYTKEELEQVFEKSIQYLRTKVLGNNKSPEQIYEKLNFISSVPGTGVTAAWQPEDFELILSDGTINNENVTEEGIRTAVTVILSCQKQQNRYSIPFLILPKRVSEEETLQKALEEQLHSYDEKTADKEYLELPGILGNYKLTWEDKLERSNITLFFTGIIFAVVCWIYADRELDNRMKKRKDQMLMDYPEIINKFTLLINAGMTVRQAWNKIAEDYKSKLEQKKVTKRYAYEEMLVTVNELNLGQAENQAYEQYGRRVGLISYIKFSSLISQNIKKGTRGFTEQLMKEAAIAFEERKDIAKRLGEEAGTKLLIPMMVMLIIVFLIIMYPAFMSFHA